jgi:hypothetical protein
VTVGVLRQWHPIGSHPGFGDSQIHFEPSGHSSTLHVFLFFIWIWLLITVVADIFRSHDLGGFAKALWVIFEQLKGKVLAS